MWLEIIQEFHKNNKQIIDFKFELHLAIYNKELLKDKIKFLIKDDKLKIMMDEKELSINEFYYWWQITRFNEIISEEELIFNNFNEMKTKINKTINNSDLEKKDNKIKKLEDHIKIEAKQSNININLLKNIRLIYPTFESIEIFLKNIKIILMNESK